MRRYFENQVILSIPTSSCREAQGFRDDDAPCSRNGTVQKQSTERLHGGVRSGVNGTPTFLINGFRHEGPFDFASLASAIQSPLQPVAIPDRPADRRRTCQSDKRSATLITVIAAAGIEGLILQ
ncbi:thioredoxin domain-containing protein [Bradyrhizobium brasilense]|nr:thioredoxin domain-containing protein [Bradyrhizobium australafricanum]WFU34332.1 thioredoxin domain-containing protein [Bradyrhizobium australafricanum]